MFKEVLTAPLTLDETIDGLPALRVAASRSCLNVLLPYVAQVAAPTAEHIAAIELDLEVFIEADALSGLWESAEGTKSMRELIMKWANSSFQSTSQLLCTHGHTAANDHELHALSGYVFAGKHGHNRTQDCIWSSSGARLHARRPVRL